MRVMRRLGLLALLTALCFPAPAFSQPDQGLAEDFARYAGQWVEALNEHYLSGAGRPQCVQFTGGDALGEYTAVDPASVKTSVVPAKRGSPAIGFLRYTETRYASRGENCAAALQGPFRISSSRRAMEIFTRTPDGWRPGPVPGRAATGKAP
jgi:hypothetical protein